MRRWKKVVLTVGIVFGLLATLFVVFIGPWPTYSASNFEQAGYYKKALAAIDEGIRESALTDTPGPLMAGWAVRKITPEIGVPLAGYGSRKGRPSTGVHDDLYVKALGLSDGRDTVVIVGSDMLIVPENIAERVRQHVSEQTPLTPNDILFSASHTHAGPGAWGPGFVSKAFSGKYDPELAMNLAKAFSGAIVEAYKTLESAELAHGNLDAPDLIKNRAREGKPTDSELSYLVVKQADGDTCYVASYSAHATVLGGGNMEFSGDYPGYLQRAIEGETGAFAMFLGGAVGSMGPRAPDAGDAFAKCQAMGEALAKRVLQDSVDLAFSRQLDIASVGVPHKLPSMQLRLNEKWRLSPFFFRIAHIDNDGWLQAVRVGDVILVGAPCDLSGEISIELKGWAAKKGSDLWALSFSGDYVGYISPDRYYFELREPNGSMAYETGLMSWCGPDQEAFFTSLIKHAVDALLPRSRGGLSGA